VEQLPLRVLCVGNELCIKIEWIGRCYWLNLFIGLVSLIKASWLMVKCAANCVVQ
jgi:hypothetical protein